MRGSKTPWAASRDNDRTTTKTPASPGSFAFPHGYLGRVKRQALGGAHRGPVAPGRQRRTIRFIQLLLALFAIGLFVFAGYSLGRATGFDQGKRANEIDAPREPSVGQAAVLSLVGLIALGGASLLGGPGGVRIPTPARLDDLAGRAESVAVQKAEEAASEVSSEGSSATRV